MNEILLKRGSRWSCPLTRSIAQRSRSSTTSRISVSNAINLPLRPYHSSGRIHWSERLPIIIRPSFWRSMVPKPFRKKEREERMRRRPSKDWNPATFFILIFVFIGSNGIHFLNLRNRYAVDSRLADNKIAVLQEVLRKVQRGEDVDVEKMLGTSDPLAEQEWQDVIDNIEKEDRLWQSSERKKQRRKAKKEAEDAAAEAQKASPVAQDSVTGRDQYPDEDEFAPKPKRSPGFY